MLAFIVAVKDKLVFFHECNLLEFWFSLFFCGVGKQTKRRDYKDELNQTTHRPKLRDSFANNIPSSNQFSTKSFPKFNLARILLRHDPKKSLSAFKEQQTENMEHVASYLNDCCYLLPPPPPLLHLKPKLNLFRDVAAAKVQWKKKTTIQEKYFAITENQDKGPGKNRELSTDKLKLWVIFCAARSECSHHESHSTNTVQWALGVCLETSLDNRWYLWPLKRQAVQWKCHTTNIVFLKGMKEVF